MEKSFNLREKTTLSMRDNKNLECDGVTVP